EIYHLSAMSFTGISWDLAHEVINTNVMGTLNVLNAVLANCKTAKVFVAGSSAVFGNNDRRLQNETTPVNPCSPYGTSKAAASNLVRNYREAYGLYATTGILFNHESPLRGIEFVSKKICRSVALISRGKLDKLHLGDTSVLRDWGYAGDYVRAMQMILQQETPEDYVVASGCVHSVYDLAREAFSYVGLDISKYVVHSEKLLRPAEISYLCGDFSKLNKKTGWAPKVD